MQEVFVLLATSTGLILNAAGRAQWGPVHLCVRFLRVQVKQLGTIIASPLSLLRNGGDFAVSSGGSTVTYFQNALDPVAAALASR